MVCQYRIWNKFLPQITGSARLEVPAEIEQEEDRLGWIRKQGSEMLQTLMGTRDDRLMCGNTHDPYRFEKYPPGVVPSEKEYTIIGMSSNLTPVERLAYMEFELTLCLRAHHHYAEKTTNE